MGCRWDRCGDICYVLGCIRQYPELGWTQIKDDSSIDLSQHFFSDVGWRSKSQKSSNDNFRRLLLV